MNNWLFIIISILIIIYIFHSIRKNKLSVNNSFIWIIFSIILLFLSIFPTSLDWLAFVLGISYPPALFLTFALVIVYMMLFIQSKKIEQLQKEIINLSQEVSILKEKKNEKK